MPLESASFINQLDGTNPPGSDKASSMDDQLRLIKNVLLNTLPNFNAAVNPTPSQLNALTSLGNSRIVLTNASGILVTSTYTSASLARIANSLTASRALASDGSGNISASAVTAVELGYLSGVTSAIQTQLNDKINWAGRHTFSYTQTTGGVWETLDLNIMLYVPPEANNLEYYGYVSKSGGSNAQMRISTDTNNGGSSGATTSEAYVLFPSGVQTLDVSDKSGWTDFFLQAQNNSSGNSTRARIGCRFTV